MLHVDAETAANRLTEAPIFDLAGEAFRLQAQGQVDQPLRAIVQGDGALLGSMPVYIKSGAYAGFGLKCVIVSFGGTHDGPSHQGLVLVYGERGTSGIATVDAGAITRVRTAAASGYATQMLARADARVLAVLGTGLQARAHVETMVRVRPVEELRIWGRDRDHAAAFGSWCRANHHVDVRVASTSSEAVWGSDIICTTTASRESFLTVQDLPTNCHINAVGASALGFQELDEKVYARAALYTDSNEAVFAASQCVIKAMGKGLIPGRAAAMEVGAIDSSRKPPSGGVTIFKSVGLAVQDLVFAREVIRRGFNIDDHEDKTDEATEYALLNSTNSLYKDMM